MTSRMSKDVWTAALPSWRQGAVGRLAADEVFLVVQRSNTTDTDRYIRVEMTAEHARVLAADLIRAAQKAQNDRQVA